ncbi:MAG: pyruvate, phosphate dikinase [Dehalococcoidia bacterium]|nr:pyruvate, phosphate dikinase [Dehalococcoidia bacterium]
MKLTSKPSRQAASDAARKWVYPFREGNAQMRDLLGGKGAGLAEMTNAGLPVPAGFTITTEACNAFYQAGEQFPPGMWEQTLEALKEVERESGKRLGDPKNPLLVSVRSGAKFSMPGMMDTVLNLGLNELTLKGLVAATGDERFGWDAYRRFIQMFGKIVLDMVPAEFEAKLEEAKRKTGARLDSDLAARDLRQLVEAFLALVQQHTGKAFPSDPQEQLRLAIQAVFSSWNNKRAIDYRDFNKIPHDLGTAVSIVAMVFGNLGNESGTGVAFTRDPATGERVLYGEYLPNAQGEDVVAGIRTPKKIAQLHEEMPAVYQQFAQIARRLEQHYRDAQDLEFTVERGRLYMLQTRSAKRTAKAAVKMAVDMANERLITRAEALLRVEPNQINEFLHDRFDEKAKEGAAAQGRLLATGLNASPGAATGQAIFDADKAKDLGSRGEAVILVRQETNPDDVHGMLVARGILTARGGATSHAAVVARGLGKPCVAGCEAIEVDPEKRLLRAGDKVVREHEEISIDGTTGQVFQGRIQTVPPDLSQEKELQTLLEWADEVRRLGVWANADYPRDAQRAVEFGAEGIGLCRTEHMFFEEERLPIVRQMILAAGQATEMEDSLAALQRELAQASEERRPAQLRQVKDAQGKVERSKAIKDYHGALEQLLQFQREDFKGIFRAMGSRPVIIRLLDPPLHEFLPRYEELLVEVTELRVRGNNPPLLEEKQGLLRAVEGMREQNPMLGLRGCRLGLLYGAINEMQVRAILEACCTLTREGVPVRPEIMIPLVGHVNELKLVREQLEAVARQVEREQGAKVPYKFGTMIEVPRACLTADEIAQHAEFFSFGTNDLTQTTFGYSRDDAEGKFLLQYVQRKILPDNPFQVLDRSGVGQLIEMAVKKGRATRPDLEVGICGEHGGDPSSIEFCHGAGLNYVSCSPFRVPIARLAAAQAALSQSKKESDK